MAGLDRRLVLGEVVLFQMDQPTACPGAFLSRCKVDAAVREEFPARLVALREPSLGR